MLSKMQAEKGLLPADSPGGTQGSGEGKAISAEDKAASGTGRDGHKLLWAGKLKLRRVFRAVEAGCSPAEVGGEAVCPRSCAWLWQPLISPMTDNGKIKCMQFLPLSVTQ